MKATDLLRTGRTSKDLDLYELVIGPAQLPEQADAAAAHLLAKYQITPLTAASVIEHDTRATFTDQNVERARKLAQKKSHEIATH